VVLVLGDHARPHGFDGPTGQRAAGRFLSPLALWLDMYLDYRGTDPIFIPAPVSKNCIFRPRE